MTRTTRTWRLLAATTAALALAGCAAEPPSTADAFSLDVRAEPSAPVTGERVRWLLELTNESDAPADLRFPTSQRGDVRLVAGHTDIYRWADDRAFSHEVGDVALAPGSSVTFALEEQELGVAPGDYELRATTSGTPVFELIRQPITVESP